MEVTITNEGGRITISDTRDPAFTSDWNELKDGIDLLQFGDAVRIIFKDGRWFESLANQTEVVGYSGSITPSDGLEYYAAMWDVLADYGSGGSSGGGTVTSVAALTIGTSGTDLSSSVANSTTTPVITLNVPTASASNRGALSSADWTTFNNKVPYTGATTNVNLGAFNITAASLIKSGGTSSQFLKADGSVDSNTYLTAAITSINTLSAAAQFLIVGSSGTDFGISSSGTTHTFNLPTASATNRGALSSTDWTTFNNKVPYTGATGNVTLGAYNLTAAKLFTSSASALATPATLFAVLDGTEIKTRTPSQVLSDIGAQTSSGVPFMCMQESYPVATNQTGILYVPSASKVYVCNLSSNSVSIINLSTGVVSTLSVTNAFQVFYIASIDEVWVTSTTLTTINRISVSSNTLLTAITGATINGADYVEYSSTKVFICCSNASGSIMLVNPSTLSVTSSITTSVPATPQGMVLNTNVASSQFNKIVISAAAGLAIFDPNTNAITTFSNPSSAVSTGTRIRYITSTNQYIMGNFGANSILILDIASATTFTLNSTIRNLPGVLDVAVDETSGYAFTVTTGLTSAAVLFTSIISLSTKKVVTTISTNVLSGSSAASGRVALDSTNKRYFVCGRSSNTNVVTTIKYV